MLKALWKIFNLRVFFIFINFLGNSFIVKILKWIINLFLKGSTLIFWAENLLMKVFHPKFLYLNIWPFLAPILSSCMPGNLMRKVLGISRKFLFVYGSSNCPGYFKTKKLYREWFWLFWSLDKSNCIIFNHWLLIIKQFIRLKVSFQRNNLLSNLWRAHKIFTFQVENVTN